jgi:hypothetical protein|tara:strand:- start:703 stop:834 length:132 start_codon:yes stop_codon:yes gene_type:complete
MDEAELRRLGVIPLEEEEPRPKPEPREYKFRMPVLDEHGEPDF